MRKWKKGWLWLICGLFFWSIPLMVRANEAETKQYVADQADLLTAEEEENLNVQAQALHEKWNHDFVVVTTDNAEGKSSESYADDYYEFHDYGENGVLYLVDLDNGNVWISTKGAAIRFLTDSRIERVLDAGYNLIREQKYAEGFGQMMQRTDSYMEQGIPEGQYNYDVETGKVSRYRSITKVEAVVVLILALLCGGGFAVYIHSSYKLKRSDYTYPFLDKSQVEYLRRDDRFINEVVTRRKIPKDPPAGSSGSGGGGRGVQSSVHTSSSGASHGGGGRSL